MLSFIFLNYNFYKTYYVAKLYYVGRSSYVACCVPTSSSYVVGKNVPTRRKNQLSCNNYTFMRNNCCAGKDSTHTNSLRTIVDTPRKLAKNKNNNNNGNLERTYTQESYSNSTFMRNSRKSRVLIKRMKSLALIKRPILERERGTFLHWKSKHKTARARLPAWLISRNILSFVMR